MTWHRLDPAKDRGGQRSRKFGSNTKFIVRPAAPVNADFNRLTARIILERTKNGTLDVAVVEALLLAVGLEA